MRVCGWYYSRLRIVFDWNFELRQRSRRNHSIWKFRPDRGGYAQGISCAGGFVARILPHSAVVKVQLLQFSRLECVFLWDEMKIQKEIVLVADREIGGVDKHILERIQNKILGHESTDRPKENSASVTTPRHFAHTQIIQFSISPNWVMWSSVSWTPSWLTGVCMFVGWFHSTHSNETFHWFEPSGGGSFGWIRRRDSISSVARIDFLGSKRVDHRSTQSTRAPPMEERHFKWFQRRGRKVSSWRPLECRTVDDTHIQWLQTGQSVTTAYRLKSKRIRLRHGSHVNEVVSGSSQSVVQSNC